MIKAVIFDCFGVLTTDGWLPFKQKYFSHDRRLLSHATELNMSFNAGLMSYDIFLSQIAELANVSYAEARKAIEGNVADKAVFDYIASELTPHYKIGMLSNVGGDWLERLFTYDQIKLFDAVALSYQTGFIKPDARAYRSILERLEVEAEECIFVDDQQRFCTAARQQGILAIHYTSFDHFKIVCANMLNETS